MTGRPDSLVLFGATGDTGRRIAEQTKKLGIETVLSGRNEAKLVQLSAALDLPWSVADIKDPASLDRVIGCAPVLLNAAGPFQETIEPLIHSCLRNRTHYLDIAGELPAFLAASKYDREALDEGIMLMPGAAFGIVATDGLAALAAARWPEARSLRIGLTLPQAFSRGSIRTMIAMVQRTVMVRRNGRIVRVPVGRLTHEFDYGAGKQVSAAINWPDPFTAYLTTGIGNIEAYAEMGPMTRSAYQAGALLSPVPWNLLAPFAGYVSKLVPTQPEKKGHVGQTVVVETEDLWHRRRSLRIQTRGAYEFTGLAAARIVQLIFSGYVRPGFRTPTQVFGAELLLSVPGTSCNEI